MPQLHAYVPALVADELRARARARGLTVSRYLAELVRRDLALGWPAHYFKQIAGGWKGPALERPPQGRLERREAL
jgi:hypothetical protein